MANLILKYLNKWLFDLYYVIIEGVLKVSHSWAPIISITGVLSLIVALPLINLVRLQSLCLINTDIPVREITVIGIILWAVLYWLSYHYYLSVCKKIEQKFQKDNMLTRTVYGMLAVVIVCISILINSWVSRLYLIKWESA